MTRRAPDRLVGDLDGQDWALRPGALYDATICLDASDKRKAPANDRPRRPTPPTKTTGAKLRRWRVSILRSRAYNLGTIEAPDAETAEAEAVRLFGLDEEQRKRLSIWARE
jgi:hypothetical protein